LVDKQRLAGITIAHDFPRWADESRRIANSLSGAPGLFLPAIEQ